MNRHEGKTGEQHSDITQCFHPEVRIDGFTKLDGTIRFYSFVKAIMLRDSSRTVLDFGAGRGAFWLDSSSEYRRFMQDLRFQDVHVTACDVDDAVKTHPCSQQQIVITIGQPLPFEDNQFDLIVSDFVFEHIADPSFVAAELLRILKPGGYVCARTANRFGYVKFMAQLIPNSLHVAFLRRIQPDREAEDVFPTVYKLNSASQVKDHFRNCDVYSYFDSAEPAYHFGNKLLYWLFSFWHKIMPDVLATSVCFFIRKH
ncbi:MAG: class I SAM-dependent methyltransferase [Mariprofundaceae bacterium]|nr:class I SAM-dependent methyltransferase [Mariprofundaceae bacterium]